MSDAGRRKFSFAECLGRGGFGEVYRASMISPGGLQTPVAVKVLRADLDVNDDAVRRLRDEGKLLARLNHPTVVKVFDLVVLEGRIALVAELVEGADLAELWKEDMLRRPLLEVLAAVAGALDAAWSTPGTDGKPLHIVHRDLKPTNIRIGRHGDVKLLDFGIASFQGHGREASTASDMLVGSLPYMAPERFLEKGARPAGDVFALGCTLFEGLVGERFFAHGQLRNVSTLAVDRGRYDAYATARLATLPQLRPSLRALLEETLRHDPVARPTSATLAPRLEAEAEAEQGPGLRTWCRTRTWSTAEPTPGVLVGQIVTEGTLATAAPTGKSARGPTVVRVPLLTVDPSAQPSIREVSAPDPAWVPVAQEPPALPAIPVRAIPSPSRSNTPWLLACGVLAILIVIGSGVVVAAISAALLTF